MAIYFPGTQQGNQQQSTSSWWNFRHTDKPDYRQYIEGTLVQIKEKQMTRYEAGKWVPDYYKDGNPVRGLEFTLLDAMTGHDIIFDFKFSKNNAMVRAIAAACPGLTDIEDLAGCYIRVTALPYGNQPGEARQYTFEKLNVPQRMDLYRGTIKYGQAAQQQQPEITGNPLGYAQPPTAQYNQQPVPQQPVQPQYQPPVQQPQYQQPIQQPQYQQPFQGQVPAPNEYARPAYQQPIPQPVPMPQQPTNPVGGGFDNSVAGGYYDASCPI